MRYPQAVIGHNVAAMRAAPDSSAEQVSQAILGEAALLLEEQGDYARIRTPDGYEGWAARRHLCLLPGEDGASAPADICLARAPIADLRCAPEPRARLLTKLTFGTRLAMDADDGSPDGWRRVRLPTGEAGYLRKVTTVRQAEIPAFSGEQVCALATEFAGTPYLWGGTTPFGFDCSGFVQRLYAFLGILLPRDAYLQAQSPLGALLAPEQPRQAGDLVFFGGERDPLGRGITHVGIALDAARFVHAVGHSGVIDTAFDDPCYARAYRCAWRYAAPR